MWVRENTLLYGAGRLLAEVPYILYGDISAADPRVA
jgi:hypothetical protein